LISRDSDFIPFFEISTNGQYNEKDARFLGNYFNKVVLSLDGFKETQNRHRPLKSHKDSFENAIRTAAVISNSSAELCIRCCVSQLNVLQLEEITQWLCSDYRLSAINFEILCSNYVTKSEGLLPPDPIQFAVNFQKSRAIANSYGIDTVYASDIADHPQVSSCPVGKDAVVISPNGRISNCYLMPESWKKVKLDLDFGFFHSKDKIDIDEANLAKIREMVEDKVRCSSCFCQWSCAGGCHVGNTFPACSNNYDDFCLQTRLISAFSLLSNLGLEEKIDQLINSNDAIMKLVKQDSDKIQDFTL
jgi:radical SAM protein with 4Fe4S-binding SPASM domain